MRFGHPVTIVRQRGQRVSDGYGGSNTRIDWSLPPAEKAICDCAIAPGAVEELRDRGREGSVVEWTVFAPVGVDVRFDDRVLLPAPWPTEPYEVEGEPKRYVNPHNGRTGATIALRKVAG